MEKKSAQGCPREGNAAPVTEAWRRGSDKAVVTRPTIWKLGRAAETAGVITADARTEQADFSSHGVPLRCFACVQQDREHEHADAFGIIGQAALDAAAR